MFSGEVSLLTVGGHKPAVAIMNAPDMSNGFAVETVAGNSGPANTITINNGQGMGSAATL